MKYECDCGRVFSDPDGPIICANSHHGQPLEIIESAPSISNSDYTAALDWLYEELAFHLENPVLVKKIHDEMAQRLNKFLMNEIAQRLNVIKE